jgi:negative regulator of flagellin synthesis FlgM
VAIEISKSPQMAENISKVNKSKQVANAQAAQTSPTRLTAPAETVSITDTAMRLNKVENSASSAINQERVASIKKAIAEGQYHIDPQRIAQKMIDMEDLLK